jgi:hypothetical protein
MARRSPEQVKLEIESERKRLGEAVTTLRSQALAAARKLPLIAVGAAGAGFAARTLGKRVFRRAPGEPPRRARRPFLRGG